MKKIIIAMTLVLMSFSTLHAMNSSINPQVLAHVNPMPNLMRIAIGNAELLDINKEQMEALKAWVAKSKPELKKMIHTVMTEEKKLLEDALTTDKDSVKDAELMLETRKQIIALKTKCRTNLKKILTQKQYEQVITIYKSVQ